MKYCGRTRRGAFAKNRCDMPKAKPRPIADKLPEEDPGRVYVRLLARHGDSRRPDWSVDLSYEG
jgi:hypothetical protein